MTHDVVRLCLKVEGTDSSAVGSITRPGLAKHTLAGLAAADRAVSLHDYANVHWPLSIAAMGPTRHMVNGGDSRTVCCGARIAAVVHTSRRARRRAEHRPSRR